MAEVLEDSETGRVGVPPFPVLAQYLVDETELQGRLQLVTRQVEDRDRFELSRERRQERALSDPRLTTDDHDLRIATSGESRGVVQRPECLQPSHERRSAHCSSPAGWCP